MRKEESDGYNRGPEDHNYMGMPLWVNKVRSTLYSA